MATRDNYVNELVRRLRDATRDFIQAQADFEGLRNQAISRASNDSTDTMIKFLGTAETKAAQADLQLAHTRVLTYSAALQGELAASELLNAP